MKALSVKESRETIVLDFDGVLHDYSEWDGPAPTGPPVKGAKDFVDWLLGRHYNVYVMSARAAHDGGIELIEEWLALWGFPKIRVTDRKIGGCLYIDDRGYRFEGDFDPLYGYLLANPKPGRWGLRDNPEE